MTQETILIVDDEPDIQELIRYNLKKEGFHVLTAGSATEAFAAVNRRHPDAIILDLMLPDMSGTIVCRRLKADDRTRHIPVIMLTAKSEEMDVVAGLETGADDYVTKPFSPRILVARLRAALRKGGESAPAPGPEYLSAHGIRLDVGRHEVFVNERKIALSSTEFALLEFFLENPGMVFSRTRIIDAVRGKDYPVTERAVDVQILGLRKKLGNHGVFIETVRGVGYRMKG